MNFFLIFRFYFGFRVLKERTETRRNKSLTFKSKPKKFLNFGIGLSDFSDTIYSPKSNPENFSDLSRENIQMLDIPGQMYVKWFLNRK